MNYYIDWAAVCKEVSRLQTLRFIELTTAYSFRPDYDGPNIAWGSDDHHDDVTAALDALAHLHDFYLDDLEAFTRWLLAAPDDDEYGWGGCGGDVRFDLPPTVPIYDEWEANFTLPTGGP